MTLLITGAAGHVGGAIVRHATSCGMSVLATCRGDPPPIGDAGARVTWLRCDLRDAQQVRQLAQTHRIDACIHAAAISNEAFARPDPLAAVAGNVFATAHLLDAARTAAWRRVVFVSTGSIFQLRRDTARPILEDEPPAPANVYSTTKHAAEMLTRMYRDEYGLSAASIRISWVYGPPIVSEAPTRGPIPSFLLRALRGEAIREGGADFAASFTHVDDVARALLAAAAAPDLRHPIYHFGPGLNLSAGDVAAAVRRAVPGAAIELGPGTEPWTRFTALRAPLAGERFLADTGCRPMLSLAAGIATYADWLRAHPALWR